MSILLNRSLLACLCTCLLLGSGAAYSQDDAPPPSKTSQLLKINHEIVRIDAELARLRAQLLALDDEDEEDDDFLFVEEDPETVHKVKQSIENEIARTQYMQDSDIAGQEQMAKDKKIAENEAFAEGMGSVYNGMMEVNKAHLANKEQEALRAKEELERRRERNRRKSQLRKPSGGQSQGNTQQAGLGTHVRMVSPDGHSVHIVQQGSALHKQYLKKGYKVEGTMSGAQTQQQIGQFVNALENSDEPDAKEALDMIKNSK